MPAIPTWLVSISIEKFNAGAIILSKIEDICIKPCLTKKILKDISWKVLSKELEVPNSALALELALFSSPFTFLNIDVP